MLHSTKYEQHVYDSEVSFLCRRYLSAGGTRSEEMGISSRIKEVSYKSVGNSISRVSSIRRL